MHASYCGSTLQRFFGIPFFVEMLRATIQPRTNFGGFTLQNRDSIPREIYLDVLLEELEYPMPVYDFDNSRHALLIVRIPNVKDPDGNELFERVGLHDDEDGAWRIKESLGIEMRVFTII
jgi:hypothetical protein